MFSIYIFQCINKRLRLYIQSMTERLQHTSLEYHCMAFDQCFRTSFLSWKATSALENIFLLFNIPRESGCRSGKKKKKLRIIFSKFRACSSKYLANSIPSYPLTSSIITSLRWEMQARFWSPQSLLLNWHAYAWKGKNNHVNTDKPHKNKNKKPEIGKENLDPRKIKRVRLRR